MGKTKETEEIYLTRAKHLVDRYFRETGCDWQADPTGVCVWLAAQRPEWSRATWRNYKASMIFFMTQNGPKEAVDYLESQDSSPCQKKTRNTSGRKMRHLPDKELAEILAALQSTRGQYNTLLGLWLSANRLLGLRPIEWDTAELDLVEKKLTVRNAKNTNGRALGEKRILLLQDLSSQNMELVAFFWKALQEAKAEKEFSEIYQSCRMRLFNVARDLWPGRTRFPTLYSSRHQLSADLKAAGCDTREIAAIFGHATDETAESHYGMKTHGKSRGGRVTAPQEKIDEVREKKTYFTSRDRPKEKE